MSWIFGLAAAALVCTIAPARAQQFWQDQSTASPPPKAQTLPDFVDLAAKLSPTVVNISTESKSDEPSGESLIPKELPFQMPPEERFAPHGVKSLGSGFIINRKGYILTNDHVVENADKIMVALTNGRNYPGKVIGRDSKTDVALLKIDVGGDLPAAPLGDSGQLKVGEWVIAIGNPFGFDHSVTAGIISAKGRFIPGSYNDYIQTDASINPGNSGGPLIDLQGAVIGVNSAIYTRTGSSMGIGFAIPINLVKEELPELHTIGKVSRGWLGVYIQKVTAPLAESMGLGEPRGALIADVLKGGPAMAAGLRRGDVIVAYDNKPIKDSQELPLMVGETPVGHKAIVKFVRDRATREVAVTITPSHEEEIQKTLATQEQAPSPRGARLGLDVQAITPEVARQLGMTDRSGVVITEVQPGSAADDAGLRRRDIIMEVNRKPVKDVQSYERALAANGAKPVLLLIQRSGNTLYVPLKRQG
ncbi:MAG TPA: Do family serine endopeptidase [Candidatus Binataceae bacterium]|nr:Do family serine endopeptidase [Candidatus Binataceae bacterium]